MVSGNANNRANAGLSYFNSNNSASNSNANIGCYFNSVFYVRRYNKRFILKDKKTVLHWTYSEIIINQTKGVSKIFWKLWVRIKRIMKRINNIFSQIINIDNLRIADKNARKGKKHQYWIKK